MAPMAVLCHLCLLSFTAFVSATAQSLLFPLTHTLSKTQHHTTAAASPSPYHLLKAATLRSTARHRHRHRHQSTHQEVSLPLSFGSDYSLSFSLGKHRSQAVSLYMDTGSDLVWLPCSPFECILCEGKPPASPHSTAFNYSTPVSCLSPSCSAAHSSLPASDLCAISGCPLESIETSSCSSFSCPPFYYAYGDGSLVALLRQDHISIPSSSKRPIQIPKFTFGCAQTTLAEPIGVAGFGRGVLSLPAQLAQVSPHLGKRFSYCLNSHSFDSTSLRRPSPLILGRNELQHSDLHPDPFVYTHVLDNPKHPYYYSVSLVAISIGGSRMCASTGLKRVDENGNGGFVVDSGTTFTMLPEKTYKRVVAEFKKRMWRFGYRRATQIEEDTGLSPCYHNVSEGIGPVPSLTLHFGGNATVVLPRRNYYRRVGRKNTGCLMLLNGGDDVDGGPAGTLGNIQQQGFEVMYDLEGRRVGFARRRCAELWPSPATRGRRARAVGV